MFYSIIYSIIPYVIVCFNATPSVIVHFIVYFNVHFIVTSSVIVTPCFSIDSSPIFSF